MPAVKLSQILQNKTDIANLVSGSVPAAKATVLNTARSVDGLAFNGSANINHYATCATAAATAAKTASLPGYSLQTGSRAMVKFTYANTAATPTLDINSSGAKAIKAFGTAASTVQWVAGDVVEFIYDGTNYIMLPTMGMVKNLDDAVDTLNTSLNGLTTNLYELDFANKIDLKTALDAVNETYTFLTNGMLCYKFISASAANAYRLNSSTGVPILFAQTGGAQYELAGRVHVSKGEIGTVAYSGITINSLYFVPFK